MAYQLPELPYQYTDLEPYLSQKTLAFHHDKHHAAYVRKYNAAVAGTPLEEQPIEAVIKAIAGDPAHTDLFNNAAQAWNHSFYWQCMKPGGGGDPTNRVGGLIIPYLVGQIITDFGSYGGFVKAFKHAATTQFGSGWAWLVADHGTLKIVKTNNADNPLTAGQTPLLTVDVWEHAYYFDYQNRRPGYIDDFVSSLINWDFVAENFAAA